MTNFTKLFQKDCYQHRSHNKNLLMVHLTRCQKEVSHLCRWEMNYRKDSKNTLIRQLHIANYYYALQASVT